MEPHGRDADYCLHWRGRASKTRFRRGRRRRASASPSLLTAGLPASTAHPRPYGRHGNRRSTEERAALAKARSAGERGPPRRHGRRALSHQRGRAGLQRPPLSRLCASKSGEKEQNGSRVFTGTSFVPAGWMFSVRSDRTTQNDEDYELGHWR